MSIEIIKIIDCKNCKKRTEHKLYDSFYTDYGYNEYYQCVKCGNKGVIINY